MIGLLKSLLRRRPEPQQTVTALTLLPPPDTADAPVAPVVAVRFEPATVEDIDPTEYDFERQAAGYASTAEFAAWHLAEFADQTGLSMPRLWTRYQIYCCRQHVRPVTQGRFVQTLKAAGIKSRRVRADGGKRPTVYDVHLRVRQRSAA